MTLVLRESDLQITIENATTARRFDDPSTHRLTHCMKAVDFIVEFPEQVLFIEFKDPQHPDSRQTDRQDLINYYQNEQIDNDLVYKFRDSFLYESAAGRAERDAYYLVLIAIEFLTSADLDKKKKDLDRKLPVGIPSTWTRPIVRGCGVFNIASWNEQFPNLQVARRSLQP